jgi:hypothetical protein
VVPTSRSVLEGLEAKPTHQKLSEDLPGLNRLPGEQPLPVGQPRAEILAERQRVYTGRESCQTVQVLELRLEIRPLPLAGLNRLMDRGRRRPGGERIRQVNQLRLELREPGVATASLAPVRTTLTGDPDCSTK